MSGQHQNPRVVPRGLILLLLVVIVLAAGWLVFPHTCGPRCAMRSREFSTVASLKSYVLAQNTFHRTAHYGKGKRTYANPSDGSGLPDLYRVGGPDATGEALDLIPLDLARATTPDRPKTGYYFVDITGEASGPYDYTKQCGLCAVPAKYGKSGRLTFIINVTGTIDQKDTGGRPVAVWPDVEKEGWEPVGLE